MNPKMDKIRVRGVRVAHRGRISQAGTRVKEVITITRILTIMA